MIRVLLVEDEAAVRNIIARMLSMDSLHVVSTATADEAVNYLDDEQFFDVAVIDRVLPGKIQGEELAATLRKTCHGIGIIYMSGYPPEMDTAQTSIGDLALCKPVSRTEIMNAVSFAYQARSIRMNTAAE